MQANLWLVLWLAGQPEVRSVVESQSFPLVFYTLLDLGNLPLFSRHLVWRSTEAGPARLSRVSLRRFSGASDLGLVLSLAGQPEVRYVAESKS